MKDVQPKVLSLTAATVAAVLLTGNASAARFANLSDTDADGVISAEEIRAAHDAQKAATLAQFDVNGDGELSHAERGAARDVREAEKLELYDTDGDGTLSHEERGTARDEQQAQLDIQLDVNGDGQVSAAESTGIEEIRAERNDVCGSREDGNGKRGGGSIRSITAMFPPTALPVLTLTARD